MIVQYKGTMMTKLQVINAKYESVVLIGERPEIMTRLEKIQVKGESANSPQAAQAREVLVWGQEAAQAREVLVWGQEAAQAREVLVWGQEGAVL